MNWEDAAVGVTGAGGFLGSHLCHRLVEMGAYVRAIDNFDQGSSEYLNSIHQEVDVQRTDIRDIDQDDIFEDLDIVYHLAAIANPRTCQSNRNLAFNVNVIGTRNVFEACVKEGVDRVIFFSSAAVYGNPDYVPIDEEHPRNGTDPYSTTKKIGEDLVEMYHAETDTEFSTVRNFNLFGPRQEKGYLIPTLITQAIEENRIEIWTADSIRDFTYVENGLDAFVAIAESPGAAGETVNVGSNMEVTSRELADRIAEEFGNVPVVNLEKDTVGSSKLVCDNTKLRDLTGWEPRVSFEDGLADTISWFAKSATSKTADG